MTKHIHTIIIFIFLLQVFTSCKDTKRIDYQPIGYVNSAYSIATGAPRQGILKPESRGVISLYPEYQEGLYLLEQFEYVYVFFHFHDSNHWEPVVSPPESDHKFGVFATRSPRRPNPVGFTLVKLDSIRENELFIRGIDMFDGTPILDIKPFLPSVDYVYSETNYIMEVALGHHTEDFINDSLVRIFVKGETLNRENNKK